MTSELSQQRNDAIAYITCSNISRHRELFLQNRSRKLFSQIVVYNNNNNLLIGCSITRVVYIEVLITRCRSVTGVQTCALPIYDQECNDIGVVIATKCRHCLYYLQYYFSAQGTVLTKSFTETFSSNSRFDGREVKTETVRVLLGYFGMKFSSLEIW